MLVGVSRVASALFFVFFRCCIERLTRGSVCSRLQRPFLSWALVGINVEKVCSNELYRFTVAPFCVVGGGYKRQVWWKFLVCPIRASSLFGRGTWFFRRFESLLAVLVRELLDRFAMASFTVVGKVWRSFAVYHDIHPSFLSFFCCSFRIFYAPPLPPSWVTAGKPLLIKCLVAAMVCVGMFFCLEKTLGEKINSLPTKLAISKYSARGILSCTAHINYFL